MERAIFEGRFSGGMKNTMGLASEPPLQIFHAIYRTALPIQRVDGNPSWAAPLTVLLTGHWFEPFSGYIRNELMEGSKRIEGIFTRTLVKAVQAH